MEINEVKMNKNIDWLVPGLFLYEEYLIAVDNITRDLGIENPIKYAYGSVKCGWTNRSYIKFPNRNFIESTIEGHKSRYEIPILNFSKHDIEKDDLNDEFCNFLLDCYANIGSEIIVSSDLLYNHIKERHPNTKINSSFIKPSLEFYNQENYDPQRELDYYNNLTSKFDKVIVRSEFLKYIQQGMVPENLDKIVLIVNNRCFNNCKLFEQCLKLPTVDFECPIETLKKNGEILKSFENLNMLSYSQVKDLSNKGFKNFMFLDNYLPLNYQIALFNNYLFNNLEKNEFVTTKIHESIAENNTSIKSYLENYTKTQGKYFNHFISKYLYTFD